MVRLVIKPWSQGEWAATVAPFQDLSLVQTWEYGEVKAKGSPWQVVRAIFVQEERVVGACQAMVRPIPYLGGGLVWINRGPLWQVDGQGDPSLLWAMLAALRRYWVEERRLYLRVAPPVAPEEATPEALGRQGYRLVEETWGWASACLDLSQSLEAIRSNLRPNWRNQLNQAERLNLAWEAGVGDTIITAALEEYSLMIRHKQLKVSAPPRFLADMQELFAPRQKFWGLIGRQDGAPTGIILLARYGDTAEYLVGAFTEAGRRANVGNFLLWRAVAQMKEQGYRRFDLGGMNPDQTLAGIYHFKSGLRGRPYRFVGELEAYRPTWRNRALRWRIRNRDRS
jgi:lipid II:glycine glycyltransferase (peptidoglycan interpeptide bridge formation enzyme)